MHTDDEAQPFDLNSVQYATSPHINTTRSNKQVLRMKEMIIKDENNDHDLYTKYYSLNLSQLICGRIHVCMLISELKGFTNPNTIIIKTTI